MTTPERRHIDVWLLINAPDVEPISLHGESPLTDHDAPDAFERLLPTLLAAAREQLAGDVE